MSWNAKLIEKLLLTLTMADPEWFTLKGKPVIYTRAFVELYNWRNHKQVHEIYEIIKLEKMRASIAENLRNLGAYWMMKILSILHSAHVVPRDQDKFVFYINNYIDWNYFNQLYDLDWIEKVIKNTDLVARKLGPALTRATNERVEVAKKKRRKREKMIERLKIEAMDARRQRAKRGISLSSKKEENY